MIMKLKTKKAFIEYLTTNGKKFQVSMYNHKGSCETFESTVTGFEYSSVAHCIYFANGKSVVLPISKNQYSVGSNGVVVLDYYSSHCELSEVEN